MFRDLKRDSSVKFLWGHQEKTLDSYYANYLEAKDIAIELPTGTGKTLVGLLIAEYRRRALDERVAFLCSTRQLCAQVARLAKKYGIPASLLVGKQAEYDPAKFAEYQQGKAIAVTTYSGIFNAGPKINDPHVLVCDDAHSADSFVSSMWTLKISRYEHGAAFMAVVNFLKAVLPENLAHKIQNFEGDVHSRTAVDLISLLSLYEQLPGLRDTLQGVVEDTDLIYSWRAISRHLQAYSLYCAPDGVELRPIMSPTLSHKPFADARQRIYMSATLGDDGDIERSFGVKEIKKLPVPEGWDRRGTGRRLMLFPGVAPLETQADATVKLLQSGGKSLILVPDNRSRDEFAKLLKQGFTVLTSADTEDEIEKFRKAAPPVVLILANRYDGIDFPGEDCRNMLVSGLPTGASLQELYMIHRLNAVSQLRDRIRTRVTQAVGRCTRDESDFSVVVIDGNDLLKWFCTSENVVGMHPELQAEVSFGISNSQDRTTTEFLALSAALLGQTSDWEGAEADIKNRRDASNKKKDALAAVLATAAKHEIDYMYNLWFGNYPKAYENADAVLSAIGGGD
jgi:RAD3-like DEAD/DEAH box helicase